MRVTSAEDGTTMPLNVIFSNAARTARGSIGGEAMCIPEAGSHNLLVASVILESELDTEAIGL